ncbi:hypothetical protein BBO99_00007932 [Phytophthora kernoviae]|uniref:Uncharacterized protein n=2 Tax=Phytophthora kernoviae TaxID=325452 RepID=A0A3R7JA24_9STRA|nr:hypothetical protein G195_009662 [Phytophthora kernoviae 00238/432]KAG2508591.1 hypothetical protein JM18_009184 [Phytophthora kernoviae]KAG2517117.1 hypothetical protein JM16_007542 [Phytophthora kernoviae]RLN26440.1 hypothetical protein BBI17_007911 [Phytophthora kernoviae]RLN75958.1 hypothetical protein BBO99_00007932 [Phytophthora kernoviae]
MQLMTDPHRPCHEESGYLTDEGHYIATMLDVNQFTDVQSVKQVFDAMQFYFMNLEITTTELGENLTNAMKFFQYVDEDDEGDGPYGIMAASPVDEDELYPYSPAERFRKDISAAMKVSAFTRKKQFQPEGEVEQEEFVVVLTRWFRVQLHHSDLKYQPHALQEVRRSVMPFTDSMIRSMNQSLYGAA